MTPRPEFDLRVESAFSNAILWQELVDQFGKAAENYRNIEHRGKGALPLMKVASMSMGVKLAYLRDVLRLHNSPYSAKDGTPKPEAEKIADSLHVTFEALFPRDLYSGKFPTRVVTFHTSEQLKALGELERPLLRGALKVDMIGAREALLKSIEENLMRAEATVIRLYFGMDNGPPLTIRAISEASSKPKIGINRVRELLARGLRKLRHPSSSHILRQYLEYRGWWL